MVTPSADVRAESRLTPRMQIYCVSALAAKLRSWEGTEILILGKKDVMVVVVAMSVLLLLMNDNGPDDGEASRLAFGRVAAENTEIGAEVKRLSSSERREGKKGRKRGRERKWL